MKQDEVRDKVQKLVALATENQNPHEGEAAADLAARLMVKYDIDPTELWKTNKLTRYGLSKRLEILQKWIVRTKMWCLTKCTDKQNGSEVASELAQMEAHLEWIIEERKPKPRKKIESNTRRGLVSMQKRYL